MGFGRFRSRVRSPFRHAPHLVEVITNRTFFRETECFGIGKDQFAVNTYAYMEWGYLDESPRELELDLGSMHR